MKFLGDVEPTLVEGFNVECQQCGSERVSIKSDVGMSPESGLWGGVYLGCIDCGHTTTIWEPA